MTRAALVVLLLAPVLFAEPAQAFRANIGFWVRRVAQALSPSGANFLSVNLNQSVSSIAIQPDLKRVLAGSFTALATPVLYSARLNSDGTLDTTFSTIGSGLNGTVNEVAIDANGKIVLGGSFTSYNGTSRPYLARFNADGSLDETFAPTGTGLNGNVGALKIDSAEKIIVGGGFTSYNSTSRPYIARLNTDGSLDTTFVPTGTGLNNTVYDVVIDGSGKHLVGGAFTSYNGTARQYLVRLNTDGSLDTSFGAAALSSTVLTLEIDGSGKILAGGSFSTKLARLNADGTTDATFALAGTGLSGNVNDIAVDSNGKIIAAGAFGLYNGTSVHFLSRLNPDGSLDTTFNQTGTGLANTTMTLAIDGAGKIVVGGQFATYNGTSMQYLARLNSDGTLDTTLSFPGLGLNSTVNALALDGSGKIQVAGAFPMYQTTKVPYIARFNTDESFDSTFATSGTGLNGTAYATAVDGSGKILIGGTFTSYNGTARQYLARLNSDGSLDTTFALSGTGLNLYVYSLAIDANGKILIGGSFTGYNGTSRGEIARINSNGTLDTTFSPGTGFNSTVNALATDANGKILAGGAFSLFNGTSAKYLVRLNSDGTLDNTFAQTGTGLSAAVKGLAIDQNGKILVVGNFYNYNSTGRTYIARLNTDGSLDTSFALTGTGLQSTASTVSIDATNKIVVGGSFLSYNGTSSPYIVRLNSDGSIDSTFSTPGFNNVVNSIQIDSSGKFVVGGNFNKFGTNPAYYYGEFY